MKKYLLIGGGFVALLILVVVLKRGSSQTTIVREAPAPLPSFTPRSSTFSPIPLSHPPVGAVTDPANAASAPPGVNPAQLVLPSIPRVTQNAPVAYTPAPISSNCAVCDTMTSMMSNMTRANPPAPIAPSVIDAPTYTPYNEPATAVAPPVSHTDAPAAPGPLAHSPYSASESLIDNDYMLLFGRHAEANGMAYWKSRLDGGLATQDLIGELTRGAQHADAVAEQSKAGLLYSNYRGNAAPIEGAIYVPAATSAPQTPAIPATSTVAAAAPGVPLTDRDTGIGRHFL